MHLPPLPAQLATALALGLIFAMLGPFALRRDGARTVLVLCNGLEVPVSRTYLAAVRAAGWPLPGSTPPHSVERSV